MRGETYRDQREVITYVNEEHFHIVAETKQEAMVLYKLLSDMYDNGTAEVHRQQRAHLRRTNPALYAMIRDLLKWGGT